MAVTNKLGSTDGVKEVGMTAPSGPERTSHSGSNRAASALSRSANDTIPASVTRAGSILHVHLVEHRPGTTDADKTVPEAWVSELHLALLLEGVYAAPRGMLNLSTALDDEQLTQVAVAYEKAFSRIAALVNANEPMNVAGR